VKYTIIFEKGDTYEGDLAPQERLKICLNGFSKPLLVERREKLKEATQAKTEKIHEQDY
jgi:hypothetical protein